MNGGNYYSPGCTIFSFNLIFSYQIFSPQISRSGILSEIFQPLRSLKICFSFSRLFCFLSVFHFNVLSLYINNNTNSTDTTLYTVHGDSSISLATTWRMHLGMHALFHLLVGRFSRHNSQLDWNLTRFLV